MAFMAYSAAKSAAIEANPKKPFLPFDAWHKTVKSVEVMAQEEINPTEPVQSEG